MSPKSAQLEPLRCAYGTYECSCASVDCARALNEFMCRGNEAELQSDTRGERGVTSPHETLRKSEGPESS